MECQLSTLFAGPAIISDCCLSSWRAGAFEGTASRRSFLLPGQEPTFTFLSSLPGYPEAIISEPRREACGSDGSDSSGPKRRGAGSVSHNMTFRYGFHSVRMSAGHPRRQRTESVYFQGTAHTNASVAIIALGITGSGALQKPIGGDPEADRMGRAC